MSYHCEHHYGPPSRDGMHGDPRAVAPPQGGLRIDVAFPQHHAWHFYQYDPAVHGRSGPHATYGTAIPHGSQLSTIDRRSTPSAGARTQRGHPAFSPQPPMVHTANTNHGGYAAPYGPSYMRGARSQISDDNIDPRLRRPDSSERSSFRLSKVTDREWRSASPDDDDDGDIGPGRGYYGRLPTTVTARYPSTDNTTTPTSETLSIAQWQEDDNYVAPEQETTPAPAPAPTAAPEMAPPAVPERPLRKARVPEKSARTIVPAPKGTVVRRRSCRKAATGKKPSLPTPSTTTAAATPEVGPSASTAKGGKGKKRALEGDVPASAVKRRKGAQSEPEPEPEAGPSTSSPDASTSTTPAAEAPAETMKCLWDGCGELVLATEHNLGKHITECHMKAVKGQKKYPCKWDKCKNEPMNYGSIRRHVTTWHLTLGATSCTVCGASLSRMDSGDRHRRESCCRCTDCGTKCATREELAVHGNLHCPGRLGGSSRKGQGKKATKAKN